MTENAVETLVLKFMKDRGWRSLRNHVGVFLTATGSSRVSIGEVGYPDWTFIRGNTPLKMGSTGTVDMMHFEAKATGKRPRKEQLEKLASLQYLGEIALWADSLDTFKFQYHRYFDERPLDL